MELNIRPCQSEEDYWWWFAYAILFMIAKLLNIGSH
jgi:hypothetical protein